MSDERVRTALRSPARLVVVEAPAGCGKTHQGAEYAKDVASADAGVRPLVLTHTHAARSEFATRTKGAKSAVDVRTIDSLIGEIGAAYHVGLDLPADIVRWIRSRDDGYAELAAMVADLLEQHPMIAASVARRHPIVVCDEHQDSSSDQHRVVMAIHNAGAALRLFADPMQRIFDDAPCDWDGLRREADEWAELNTPHRWAEGCQELGRWTLDVRRSLEAGGTVDLRPGMRPRGLEIVFAENNAKRNLAYQLSRNARRPIDGFEQRGDSLLVLTRHNATAMSLRSFFNRRVPLWEGHTRQALDTLVDRICHAREDPDDLARSVLEFIGKVAKGFSPSAFGNTFQREVATRCAAVRRDRPKKIQEVARLLLDDPSHRGVSAVLRRLEELARTDSSFSNMEIDRRRELWEAIDLGNFDTIDDGLVEINHRRNYSSSGPPRKAISTIHKAKGLEGDSALVLPCAGKTFPDNRNARCLLYVAISRAKRRLMIVLSRKDPSPLLIV